MARVHRPAFHLLTQRRSLDELVGQIEPALVIADVEERRDVGMGDLRGGARVVHQPFVARPDGQRLPLELQRDGAADLGIARAIDVAEDAFADAFEQVVVRDGTEHRSDGRSYLLWLRWPELDAAREASRRHLQKVDDDLGDVFRLDLPVGAIGAAPAAESGRDRARHHAADPDVVVAHLLHQRFRERVEAGLRGAVGRAAGKRILSRQAADVDDPAAAPLPQVRNGRVAAIEDAAEVRVDHRLPVRDRHVRGILRTGRRRRCSRARRGRQTGRPPRARPH